MRRPGRLLGGSVLGIAFIAGIGLAVIEWRSKRHFDAPYPVITATQDAAVVARGEYIVHSAAACAYCHVPREQWSTLAQGKRLPLTGHHRFPLPFGTIYSANLTADPVTGIGKPSDGELAAMLRYGWRADGRAAFPLMDIHLTDDDLTAVISYLRSQAAVTHA